MSNINIAFAFDYNYYRQAIIAISSLLDCARNKFFYNIYCLIKKDITPDIQQEIINELTKKSKHSKIIFLDMADYFDRAHECRGISNATYFKLALHRLLPIDKIIYSDVDVLFNTDLSEIDKIDISPYFLGAVKDIIYNTDEKRKEVESKFDYWSTDLANIGKNYRNGGFWLINLKKFREADFDDKIAALSEKNYNFQDQDLINVLFVNNQDKILTISPRYIVLPGNFPQNYKKALQDQVISKQDYRDVLERPAIFHYAGRKPWDDPTLNMADKWWKYVKRNTSYYSYFINKLPKELRPQGIKRIFKTIFSVVSNGKHKKITILGLKFKIKNTKE